MGGVCEERASAIYSCHTHTKAGLACAHAVGVDLFRVGTDVNIPFSLAQMYVSFTDRLINFREFCNPGSFVEYTLSNL